MSNPAQGAEGAETMTAAETVTILYENYRGETAVRRIIVGAPRSDLTTFWIGASEWHSERQWLFSAWDLDKQAYRDFAMAGIKAWGQAAVDVALASPRADSDERTAGEDDWRDDRWNAGLGYGQDQLCRVLGVNPDNVSWDAATETLDGDVQSVICNILRAWAGDDWRALAARPAAPEAQGAWSFDMEAAPRDGTHVIVAAESHHKDGEPIVGEAYVDTDNGGHWWWAGESYGDYHASPLHEVGNPPYAWHPMLSAPPTSSGQGGR